MRPTIAADDVDRVRRKPQHLLYLCPHRSRVPRTMEADHGDAERRLDPRPALLHQGIVPAPRDSETNFERDMRKAS